jgi:hypothetical protein
MNLAFSQDKFREDYSYVSVYDESTEKWGEWKKGSNTFVFNINENKDICQYKSNGELEIFFKISDIEKEQTNDGENYQIFKELDENGNVLSIQYFENSAIGLKLMWANFVVQFSQ